DTGTESKEESLAKIIAKLEDLGYIRRGAGKVAAKTDALVAPHGGGLVGRFVAEWLEAKGRKRIITLPLVGLDERAGSDGGLIAGGWVSPLKGLMGSKDYLGVVREMRLENGLPWSMPITLSVSEEHGEKLSVGAEVALRARDGRLVAVMEISDKYRPDKD